MGKKYIVEIGRLERLYKAYVNGNGKPNLTWLSPEVDLTPYNEPGKNQQEAYQRGLNDAWDTMRKIRGMTWNEQREVFGTDYFTDIIALPASECIEKIRQYEQEKDRQARIEYNFDEIKDVLETTAKECNVSLDEIAEVLQKMKETDNG